MSILSFFVGIFIVIVFVKFLRSAEKYEQKWMNEVRAIFPEEEILNPEVGIMYFKLPSGRYMCIYHLYDNDGSNFFIMKDDPPQPQMV